MKACGCFFLFLIVIITIILLFPHTTIPECTANECSSIPQGFPFPIGQYTITNEFMVPDPYSMTHSFHTGIDMVPNSTWYGIHKTDPVTLLATMDGILLHYYSACGGYAAIIHNDNYTVYYGHIQQFLVSNESRVFKGEEIAIMGESGSCQTGAHVHYEIHRWINKEWVLVNPHLYEM